LPLPHRVPSRCCARDLHDEPHGRLARGRPSRPWDGAAEQSAHVTLSDSSGAMPLEHSREPAHTSERAATVRNLFLEGECIHERPGVLEGAVPVEIESGVHASARAGPSSSLGRTARSYHGLAAETSSAAAWRSRRSPQRWRRIAAIRQRPALERPARRLRRYARGAGRMRSRPCSAARLPAATLPWPATGPGDDAASGRRGIER